MDFMGIKNHLLLNGTIPLISALLSALAKIKVVLPKGTSSSPVDLLSPNYPQSFPADDLVQWEIQLPGRHSAAVQVVNHTEPACRKKGTAGVYGEGGRAILGLSDPRPAREKHNFTMTLKNCETGRTRRSPRGLSLHLRVTATPTGKPGLCVCAWLQAGGGVLPVYGGLLVLSLLGNRVGGLVNRY